jgi:branched-chain amino acid transport system ATP-binding protein
LLQTKNLTKNFKGLCAVNHLNLSIDEGEIVGIIGPNGAGKTTTFDLITGFLQPTYGNILFEGKDITGRKPHRIARNGIIRTFQLDRIFHDFTVFQNIVAASNLVARIGLWEAVWNTSTYSRKDKNTWDHAEKIIQFIGLDDKKNEIARNLSHGHQKLLGIAVALAANPKLLLLDEPLAGMNPLEVTRALETIGQIRRRGIAILLIEHNMRAVMSICDRMVVLNFGTEIAEGAPEELKQNEEVIQAYLGAEENAA